MQGTDRRELRARSCLNIDSIRTDTSLAGVAEFGEHGAVHSGVQVGIVEDDQRRVASQLKAHLHACMHGGPSKTG